MKPEEQVKAVLPAPQAALAAAQQSHSDLREEQPLPEPLAPSSQRQPAVLAEPELAH